MMFVIRKLLVLAGASLALAAGAATAQGSTTAHQVAKSTSHAVAPDLAGCRVGYYKNVNGVCVKRPGHDPRGATAKCRDGTYSYSRHASGTCSHHGGVLRWIHHP
jgi:uncharacterized protein DUF3761